jgi:hypothetical protein
VNGEWMLAGMGKVLPNGQQNHAFTNKMSFFRGTKEMENGNKPGKTPVF